MFAFSSQHWASDTRAILTGGPRTRLALPCQLASLLYLLLLLRSNKRTKARAWLGYSVSTPRPLASHARHACCHATPVTRSETRAWGGGEGGIPREWRPASLPEGRGVRRRRRGVHVRGPPFRAFRFRLSVPPGPWLGPACHPPPAQHISRIIITTGGGRRAPFQPAPPPVPLPPSPQIPLTPPTSP